MNGRGLKIDFAFVGSELIETEENVIFQRAGKPVRARGGKEVDIIVAGSAIFKGEKPEKNTKEFLKIMEEF